MFAAALQHATPSAVTPSLDHEEVESAHDQAYNNDDAGSMDARSMGSAAAMQAFKMFTGGGGASGGASGGAAGGGQSQLLSMAMAEATKLFDSQGGAASGNKQDAINSAVKTVLKLVLQSKMGAGAGAGAAASQGGLGSLMSIASQFL